MALTQTANVYAVAVVTLLGFGWQYLFRSHQGLFTARADGSGLQHLMALETFGTLQWIP